ncbi:MAG: VacJ family lipoprotein [Pseudomonadota bacterium]
MKKVLLTSLVFCAVIICVTGVSPAQTDHPFRAAGDSAHEQTGSIDDPAVSGQADENIGYDEEYDDEDYLSEEGETGVAVSDPLRHWNILMYHFNDRLYFWFLKPVSQGYKDVVPERIRKGIWNFFTNLESPVLFVNCLLQGKGTDAEATFARFLVNTTIGFAGFGDPAGDFPKLKKTDEDLGQTFGYWGIGDGWYLILPVFGPSTIRDAAGMAGDMFLKPTYYIQSVEVPMALEFLETINSTSFRIGDYETIKDAALDPYEALRDGYLQYRKNKVSH